MKTTMGLLAFAVSLAVLLGSCSSGPSATPAETQPAPSPNEVQIPIEGFAYHPADLTIPIGTTVTWTNKDGAPHTSTSDDGLWDSRGLGQGDSYSHTFDQAGTFNYHCSIHSSIKGTITVTQ